MYTYQAYGLGIHSELPIRELTPYPTAQADVTIRVGPEAQVTHDPPGDGPCAGATEHEARFAWAKIGSFDVRKGRHIDIRPHPGVDRQILCLPLLGVVFGALLHQRDLVVLHASSVLIDGEAVAFAGGKGFGKSTQAAAMFRIGYPVLGDDVAAIELRNGEAPLLYPAYPSVHVWPHAARMLGDDPDHLPPLRAGGVKRALSVERNFEARPVPLQAIYLLDFGSAPSIQQMKNTDAFARLLPHCYEARYFNHLDETPRRLLAACSELMRHVPVQRLIRRDAVKDAFDAAHRIEMNTCCHISDSPHHAAA